MMGKWKLPLPPVCGIFAVTALLLGGCQTPFLPVAVPNSSTIKAERPVDHSRIYAELEKLQRAGQSEYAIAPGDVFAIAVAGNPEYSRPTVLVMNDGSISVAPIGKAKVAGLTFQEAGKLLNEKYKKYLHEPGITLEPVKIREQVFTIGGKVNTQGIYPILIGTTRLTDAIAMAGGLQSGIFREEQIDYADLANSYISRNGRVLPVDFAKALVEGDRLHNIPIMNGDYIYIAPLASGKITILGEVSHPASMAFQPKLTLLQAIGFAGGIKPTTCEEVKVIRGGLKDPVVYTLPVNDLLMGRQMDFPLEPLDIVYIPRDSLSKWNVIVNEILPTFQLLNSMAGPFGNPASVLYNND